MTPRSALAPLAALAFALAACTPAYIHLGSVTPASVKAGQSWVITRPAVAAQALDACARDTTASISGYWAPSRAQIDAMESRLAQLQPRIAAPRASDRQYIGIESGGKRLIYINAFTLPDGSALDPSRAAIASCNDDAGTWNALYDPQTGAFSNITSH